MSERWIEWTQGVQYEVDFWDRYIEKKGEPWPEDFKRRLLLDSPLDEWIERVIYALNQTSIAVLDVGAGPLTCLGKLSSKAVVDITATDPLADYYNEILKKYEIAPPIRTEFGLAEDLSLIFDPDTFDIVHCQNALDHAIDPIRCLSQMLNVCRIGGYVMLRHAHNEAEHESYSGFHKWNLTNDGSEFILWNQTTRENVSQLFNNFAVSEILLDEGYLINTFKKLKPVPDVYFAEDRQRYQAFLRKFVMSLGSVPS